MAQPQGLSADPLFLGMTRPPMIGGVTYSFCVLNGLLISVLFLGMGSLMMLFVALPVHGIGVLACHKDPHQFTVLFAWVRVRGQSRNTAFWGATSYAELS